MKTITMAFLALFFLSPIVFADGGVYKGPDNPNIPADKKEIRLKMTECIADINEVFGDNDAHDAAKDLCALRKKHYDTRQTVLKRMSDLVAEFKGVTNHDHDQNLGKTITLIQENINNCIDALASQEYCHNINCATDPEIDAAFCEEQALTLINRILGQE